MYTKYSRILVKFGLALDWKGTVKLNSKLVHCQKKIKKKTIDLENIYFTDREEIRFLRTNTTKSGT